MRCATSGVVIHSLKPLREPSNPTDEQILRAARLAALVGDGDAGHVAALLRLPASARLRREVIDEILSSLVNLIKQSAASGVPVCASLADSVRGWSLRCDVLSAMGVTKSRLGAVSVEGAVEPSALWSLLDGAAPSSALAVSQLAALAIVVEPHGLGLQLAAEQLQKWIFQHPRCTFSWTMLGTVLRVHDVDTESSSHADAIVKDIRRRETSSRREFDAARTLTRTAPSPLSSEFRDRFFA